MGKANVLKMRTKREAEKFPRKGCSVTSKRKARQAALIRTWRPWEKSTGPRTATGKARVSKNADRGGTWRMLRELRRALRGQDEARRAADTRREPQGNHNV